MAGYKENKTDFDTVMKDITELFGLQAPNGEAEATNQADSKDVHPEGEEGGSLVMTDYEMCIRDRCISCICKICPMTDYDTICFTAAVPAFCKNICKLCRVCK